jgi:phenylalanyl-tRNA synthetase beta chain
VVVATVGTTIHPTEGEPFKIKKAKIRGEESRGMICAEDEIGLGGDHDGIMVLDEDAVVGTAATDYFNVESDYIIEIGLTPNRADGNSHIGVARDLIAALNVREGKDLKLDLPDLSSFEEGSNKSPLTVEIQDESACPRYSGLVIKDVKVGPSPDWLRNALQAIGLKPKNNVVDITNFVLFEYGQPLHAFDLKAIKGNKVIVKKLPGKTKFTTLDEVERELHEDDLVICNAEEGMCIAGVFGGLGSGVTEETTDVFIESAYFEPVGIRKTSTRHLLRTDAATHYEKGCDPNITLEALKRAAILIRDVANGKIDSKIVDAYPNPIEPFKVNFRQKRLELLTGIEISESVIRRALESLEIKIIGEQGEVLGLEVPTYRSDVRREVDVIEEIMRIYGFDNIPIPIEVRSSLSHNKGVDEESLRVSLSRFLNGMGLTEIMTNSISQSQFFGERADLVQLANSMTTDLDVMRPDLLPSGLEVIRHNLNRQVNRISLFEFGRSYQRSDSGFKETEKISLFMSGNRRQESWLGIDGPTDFFYLKGLVEAVLTKLGLSNLQTEEAEDRRLQYGLMMRRGNREMLRFGKVKPGLLRTMDIKEEVLYAELDWVNILEAYGQARVKVKEVPKFPAVRRDLALLLDDKVKFEAIAKVVAKSAGDKLNSVDLFDVYRGDKIESGKKSYAISMVFQDAEKTLKDKEVDKMVGQIVDQLQSKLGADIRQ